MYVSKCKSFALTLVLPKMDGMFLSLSVLLCDYQDILFVIFPGLNKFIDSMYLN